MEDNYVLSDTRTYAYAANALLFVTVPMAWGQSLASNLKCSREAGY